MKELEKLNTIRKVPVRQELWNEISSKIEASQLISMNWVRAAAAVLLVLVSTEFYAVLNASQSSSSAQTLVENTSTLHLLNYE